MDKSKDIESRVVQECLKLCPDVIKIYVKELEEELKRHKQANLKREEVVRK